MSTFMKALVLLGLVSMAWVAVPASAQRGQPPRLVVVNYTGAVIDVSSVNGERQARGRLNPGSSMPISGVKNGDQFEAVWPGGSAKHTVELKYDQAYGALQDTWAVQR